MSTEPHSSGGKAEIETDAKDLMAELQAAAEAEEKAQQNLFGDPLTAGEIADAIDEIGAGAGRLTVLRAARKARGRKKGSKNRANKTLQEYLLQFGPHPLVAAMRVVAEDELDMVALSAQVDPTKKQLSFAEARALRLRSIELLAPYFEGKQPVQIDATIRGVHVHSQIGDIRPVDGGAVRVPGVLEAGKAAAMREDGEVDDE